MPPLPRSLPTLRTALVVAAAVGAVGLAYWKFAIPTHRVAIASELVMLGDLDGDGRWTPGDMAVLEAIQKNPSSAAVATLWRLDLNQNGWIDQEDVVFLQTLVDAGSDPYAAKAQFESSGNGKHPFPRPREFYRYRPLDEYQVRPGWLLSYPVREAATIPLWEPPTTYADQLDRAISAEQARFSFAWAQRVATLTPVERDYARRKLVRVGDLAAAPNPYEELLALIELTEDAETLTVRGQPAFPLQLLTFRDHLRSIPATSEYAAYAAGKTDWKPVLQLVSKHLQADTGLVYDLATLPPPRDLTNLKNYLDRTEWQVYKSTTKDEDFRQLIAFAQHDARYLRAVARTSPKLRDPSVENHNLPMVLLFREALRITDGDKKKAVGLLDEAIRIPYAWVKSLPREKLPSSLALDNFLLPGNKEDGADKSRHWNVFGGVALYKSPQEALDLALRREMQDLRDERYSEVAMREFLRDMIANLNGIYHVLSVDPNLLSKSKVAP